MNPEASRLSSNPVFVRLAGHNRWIPPIFFLVLVLITQSTVTSLLSILYVTSISPSVIRTMLAGWLIVLIAPSVFALFSTIIVSRGTEKEDYQLLKLTNLSAGRLVDGYTAGALYRMRFLLILLAVLMSWLASAMIANNITDDPYLPNCGPIDLRDLRCTFYASRMISLRHVATEATMILVLIWELVLLATHIGMLLALKWQHRLNAITPLAVTSALLVAGTTMCGSSEGAGTWIFRDSMLLDEPVIDLQLVRAGICMGILALTLGIRRLAQRLV